MVEQPISERAYVSIRADGRRARVPWQDLWDHRELFLFLAARDVQIRYKQTALGVLWTLLQPVLTVVVFTLFFGRLAGMPSDGLPYPIFAYTGLLLWNLFASAVTSASNSLVLNSGLLTKIYFPRLIIPAAAAAARLVEFGVASSLLLVLLPIYGLTPSWAALAFPALALLTALLAFGLGAWFSALNVRFRDVGLLVPFLLQVLMFCSPVIYSSTFVPERWRWLLALNPLTGLIQGSRAAMLGVPLDGEAVLIAIFITGAVLTISLLAFGRMEQSFADLV